MIKRCHSCSKVPHATIRGAIKFQFNTNQKIKRDRPFTVYKCPHCNKYLVSLKQGMVYQKELQMTDFNKDYLDNNPKWDEKEEAVEGGGKTKFAKMRLYYPLHVNRFKKGEHFTLPDVFDDDYDENTEINTRVGIKEFRGMTLAKNAGKYHMALTVLELQNKHEQWYQKQIQFCNWKDKDDDGNLQGCAWLEFQKAEMENLSPADRNASIQAAKDSAWAYIQYNEAETGYEGKYEIKKYLTDIVVFKNEKEWQAAQAEFQAQFSDDNATSAPDNSHYPTDWTSGSGTVEKTLAHFREPAQLAMDNKTLAKQAQLIDTKTPNGKDVNTKAMLAEIREVAEAFIEWPLTEDDIHY